MNAIGTILFILGLLHLDGYRHQDTYLTKRTGKVMEINWLKGISMFIIVYMLYFTTQEYNINIIYK